MCLADDNSQSGGSCVEHKQSGAGSSSGQVQSSANLQPNLGAVTLEYRVSAASLELFMSPA
jgi:hypothetical protein